MKPPFPYYGGKHYMMKYIMSLQLYMNGYIEPFAGSLGVFFARPPVNLEAIGDTNELISGFYETVKNPALSNELQIMINGTLHCEAQTKRALDVLKNPGKFGQVVRAWALWCVLVQSVGCTIGSGWSLPSAKEIEKGRIGQKPHQVISNKFNVQAYARRLERVSIFNRDALEIIERMDCPKSYFYLDPPYPGHDQGHYKAPQRNFLSLLELLTGLKGKFLLSSGDYPYLEELALKKGWNHKKISMASHAGPRVNKKYTEVLTWNYSIQRNLFEERGDHDDFV